MTSLRVRSLRDIIVVREIVLSEIVVRHDRCARDVHDGDDKLYRSFHPPIRVVIRDSDEIYVLQSGLESG